MSDDHERPIHESEIARNFAEVEKFKGEVRQLDANAKKAEADAARATAEARKLDAETREATAEAEIAEHDRDISAIKLDKEREKRGYELATDRHHHFYKFIGSVGADSVTKCINQLDFWARTDPGCPIEIEFFSPGGSVLHGMALFDRIQDLRRADHAVTTSTKGYAASMGGILLQAGDLRVMGREAYVLIHEVQAGMIGTMGEIEDEVEFLKKIQSRILEIYASRSKLSKNQLARRWKRKNWWLDSTECLKLGLVDEVR